MYQKIFGKNILMYKIRDYMVNQSECINNVYSDKNK